MHTSIHHSPHPFYPCSGCSQNTNCTEATDRSPMQQLSRHLPSTVTRPSSVNGYIHQSSGHSVHRYVDTDNHVIIFGSETRFRLVTNQCSGAEYHTGKWVETSECRYPHSPRDCLKWRQQRFGCFGLYRIYVQDLTRVAGMNHDYEGEMDNKKKLLLLYNYRQHHFLKTSTGTTNISKRLQPVLSKNIRTRYFWYSEELQEHWVNQLVLLFDDAVFSISEDCMRLNGTDVESMVKWADANSDTLIYIYICVCAVQQDTQCGLNE